MTAYIIFFNYIEIPSDAAESAITKIEVILLSFNAQLEFLTLIGIILNAFM